MSLQQLRSNHLKELGAFYTPATVAGVLASWIVRSGTERLLEPSVGDGALLDATLAAADAMGGGASKIRFLVCDINPDAMDNVLPKLPFGSEARAIDFLQLDPASTGKFSGVIANPPFTRNHSLSANRRTILRERFGVAGAAGLWVHFLLHAVDFLEVGGRLAAIVPGSALFTRYGRKALEQLADQFRSVELLRITEKPLWVNGADERGAIVLADGYRQGTCSLPEPTPWSGLGDVAAYGSDGNAAFERIAQAATPLASLATLSIGLVTGCNSVFLMSEAERTTAGISREDVVPVVARARQVPGLFVGAEDLIAQASLGQRTWLLAPRSLGPRGGPVRHQLAKISARRRLGTVWFRKRTPWWRVQTGERCDAVFTYMNDQGPRLVLARGGTYCTNTLHRVTFLDETSHEQRLAAALSMISTFGQLAGERVGRSYGGGVLKFELTEARRMPVLPPSNVPLDPALLLADQALRLGDRETARAIADTALVAPILGDGWQEHISAMALELTHRRTSRQGRRV